MALSASERRRLVAEGVKKTDLRAGQSKFQRPRENAFSSPSHHLIEGPPLVDQASKLGVTVDRQPKLDGPPKIEKGRSTQGSPSTHTGRSTQSSLQNILTQESVALSALQWKVFQHLKELFQTSHETNHAQVARLLRESKSSVDKATNKLRAFGLIDFKRERRADFQGYQLTLIADHPTHVGSKSEVFRPGKPGRGP